MPDSTIATLFTSCWIFFSLLAVVSLLIQRREPSSTLAWLFSCIFIPILGPLLYFVFGPQRLERIASKRKERLHQPYAATEDSVGKAELERISSTGGPKILQLARQISEYAVTAQNSVEMLPDPAVTFREMELAIDGAEVFVHLEYYIIASDDVTSQLMDSLLRARARGVEVRVLYDAFGSIFWKRRYFKELVERGAKVSGFLPLSLLFNRFNPHFRNHRKILIVDGKLAFTGGTNIGKEYLGRLTESQWRDFTVKLVGPVVLQLQDVFAQDWEFATKEDLHNSRYYPPADRRGTHLIQVVESGPDSQFRALHQAIFLAINSAEHSILLTTPYFIPDGAISTALVVAAMRGVEVKILLPYKNDSFVVRQASRSFYETFLRAGVEIYEYEPTILHAKMLVLDGKWTMFGSANMDMRSFRLNFELNLFVYGTAVAARGSELFYSDVEKSKKVDAKEFEKRPLTVQMLENACRLFSPIL